jgi:hypothetical protein
MLSIQNPDFLVGSPTLVLKCDKGTEFIKLRVCQTHN